MDLDYFFHEKDFKKIKSRLEENFDKPAVAFPKMQFFTPDRCTLKTNIVIAYNKKFSEIKLNGIWRFMLTNNNGKMLQMMFPYFQIFTFGIMIQCLKQKLYHPIVQGLHELV